MDLNPKIFYGTMGFLGFASVAAGFAAGGPMGLVFGLFAYLVLAGSIVCLWEPSIVRSAFALLGTFGGVAGLFLLLGADFLAVSQILIYVGGILALILFGVMLTPPDLTERQIPRVVGSLAFAGIGVAFVAAKVATTVVWAKADVLPEPGGHAREIGVAFLNPDGYMIAFELAAVLLTVALVAAVYIARRRKTDFEEEGQAV
jgi:NADH:ubiquinone oxidoreductase subunit 6 (subunit J)